MAVTLGDAYAGRCVFCGRRGPLTDEHVFSRGVRPRMPATTSVQAVRAGVATGRPTGVLNVVLKDAVCETCNRTWMSALEKVFVASEVGAQLGSVPLLLGGFDGGPAHEARPLLEIGPRCTEVSDSRWHHDGDASADGATRLGQAKT